MRGGIAKLLYSPMLYTLKIYNQIGVKKLLRNPNKFGGFWNDHTYCKIKLSLSRCYFWDRIYKQTNFNC